MALHHGSEDNQDLKEHHQQLAAEIKGLHKQLRRAYRENGGDYVSVWNRHAQDHESLQRYAQAMHLLATQHWASHPDTRIQWCRRTALEYFMGGGMRRALEKDARRRLRSSCVQKDKCADQKKDQRYCPENADGKTWNSSHSATLDKHEPHAEILMENIQENISSPPTEGCLRLLDVGSCYNPFLECPEFESIGIDLCPATENVYQCDFLKLDLSSPAIEAASARNTTSSLESKSLTSTLGLSPDPRLCPVTCLPRCSFHVVVFSLLLEYLPAAAQRWDCCVKAHQLLVLNGLLLIITPDSNSANRNAPMMKSWREALEHVGFHRWKYHKMEHVHCMAFRKVREKPEENCPEAVQNFLYIPQDFSDACYHEDHLPNSLRSMYSSKSDRGDLVDPQHEVELENFLCSTVAELPFQSSESGEES